MSDSEEVSPASVVVVGVPLSAGRAVQHGGEPPYFAGLTEVVRTSDRQLQVQR